MKKVLFLMFISSVTSMSAQTQDGDYACLPSDVVLRAFEKMYPTINKSTWTMEKSKYKVGFQESGRNKFCLFDSNGWLLETETEITFVELPTPVQKVLSIKRALNIEKIHTIQGTTLYEIKTYKKNVYFEANGNPFGEKKIVAVEPVGTGQQTQQ